MSAGVACRAMVGTKGAGGEKGDSRGAEGRRSERLIKDAQR